MHPNSPRTSLFVSAATLILLAGGVPTAHATPQDRGGCADHPLVQRYEGSRIYQCDTKEFDSWNVPLGHMQGIGKWTRSQPIEGKITWIHYTSPKGRSVLEVYRNYETAFRNAGMEVVFTCRDDECGPGYGGNDARNRGWRPSGEQRQLTAKLSRPEGDVWVSLHVWNGNHQLTIGELKPMETGLVTVDAAAMAGDIGREGHAAVYGIYFDTGKADLKPESDPAIAEVAKLLKADSALRLWVVGHTDSTGDYETNLDLSRRRAAAVIAALTGGHGIAAERLQPAGVGPLAPVASNATEEGRAKNRRVELVKR